MSTSDVSALMRMALFSFRIYLRFAHVFVMEVSYLEAAGSRECLARYLQRQNVRYGGDAVLSMWRTSAYYCER